MLVAAGEVGNGIHRHGACEQARMTRDEQQGLLPTHAAAERVDPFPVDPEPRKRAGNDLRHPGKIVDLPGIAVREAPELPAHPVRVHDREAADGGKVAPELGVGPAKAA